MNAAALPLATSTRRPLVDPPDTRVRNRPPSAAPGNPSAVPGNPSAVPGNPSAVPGNEVAAGLDPAGVVETDVSVLVMAPVLTLCRYLADIANIARGLPGVRSVHAGEQQTLTIRYGSIAGRIARLAPGRFRIDQQRQQVDWEIHASALYSGTLSIHGDSNISRLQSTLRIDQPSLSGVARDVHLQMLRRIARTVEDGLGLLRAPAAGDPSEPPPTDQQLGAAPAHPEQLSSDSPAVLGNQGLVREYWAADVPGLVVPEPSGR